MKRKQEETKALNVILLCFFFFQQLLTCQVQGIGKKFSGDKQSLFNKSLRDSKRDFWHNPRLLTFVLMD